MTEPQEHPNDEPFRQARQVLSPAAEKLDQHLTASIAALTPPETGIPVSAPTLPTGKPHIMRGLQRLSNLAPTIMASLDAKADTIADELVAQQKRAESVIEQFGALAGTLGKVADDVQAALGQITNDPTQVSGA